MSWSTQDKFMHQMKHLARKRGLDLVVDHSFTNTGRVDFQRRDSFEVVLSFHFDFQVSRARFTARGSDPSGRLTTEGFAPEDPKLGHILLDGGRGGNFPYTLDQVVAWIDAQLDEGEAGQFPVRS